MSPDISRMISLYYVNTSFTTDFCAIMLIFKVAGTLINMHNIHNLWSPQKCASVNAVLCVELRHLAIARAQTCILIATLTSHPAARDQKPQKLTQLYTRYIFYVLLSFATVLAIKGLAAAS